MRRREGKTSMSTWQTSDIYLASFLMASEHSNLKNIIDGPNGKKLFVFESEPSNSVIMKFYTGEEKVKALKLFEAFQRLKSATYVLNSQVRR